MNLEATKDLQQANGRLSVSHTKTHIEKDKQSLDITAKLLRQDSISTSPRPRLRGSITGVVIDDQPIADVESFTYLGSVVKKPGDTDKDVKIRNGKAKVHSTS